MKQIKAIYRRDMHCCGPSSENASLTLEICDGGGGGYLVVNAEHWALSDAVEIDAFANKLKQFFSENEDAFKEGL